MSAVPEVAGAIFGGIYTGVATAWDWGSGAVTWMGHTVKPWLVAGWDALKKFSVDYLWPAAVCVALAVRDAWVFCQPYIVAAAKAVWDFIKTDIGIATITGLAGAYLIIRGDHTAKRIVGLVLAIIAGVALGSSGLLGMIKDLATGSAGQAATAAAKVVI